MGNLEINKLLERLYFDPENPSGFSSKRKLLSAAKKINKSVKKRDVDNFFSEKIIPRRYSTPRTRKFQRRKFLVGYPDAIWGCDLADMSSSNPGENNNFRFILIVQDLFSKMCIGLLPLRNKKSETCAKAFEQLFETFGKKPKKILTNKDKFNKCCHMK